MRDHFLRPPSARGSSTSANGEASRAHADAAETPVAAASEAFAHGVTAVADLLRRAEDLPSLPAAAARVIQLAGSPDVPAKQVSDAVSMDPALTARVLRVVNSAAFGMSRQITTVSHAVVIMGMSALRSAIISATVAGQFRIDQRSCGVDPVAFWHHSAASGAGSRLTAKHLGLGVPGEMFVAGLLHDMGRLVLARLLPEHCRRIARRRQEENVDILQAELDEFGCTHCHAGWWLADQWNLPEQLQWAAGHHHGSADASYHASTVAVTHVGDLLARAAGADEGEAWPLRSDDAAPEVSWEGWIHPDCWETMRGLKRDLTLSEMPILQKRLQGELSACSVLATGLAD